ncbi:hypothetical protein MSAN_00269700 [Mycena sanguinolenta]|uniref:Uncharacterized protein n=1 Tax=Mycena sanguinolenta TaxID=230812 RepID=A0A8H7DK83_9AGAR|nr:hypothetical protein MSAN_00269700 [Mycena sanguinolenta]
MASPRHNLPKTSIVVARPRRGEAHEQVRTNPPPLGRLYRLHESHSAQRQSCQQPNLALHEQLFFLRTARPETNVELETVQVRKKGSQGKAPTHLVKSEERHRQGLGSAQGTTVGTGMSIELWLRRGAQSSKA